MTVIPIVVDALGTVSKGLERGIRNFGNRSDYGIAEIGQNTEKSPGDMKRVTVTPPVNAGVKISRE